MNSLLKRLQNKEIEYFGENDFRISSNIKNHLVPVAATLLGRIPAYMPEYTIHDVSHCESILKNIEKILPPEIDLNIIELTILIYSVYLHDIGMVIPQTEVENIRKTSDYNNLLFEFDGGVGEEEILTEYIRRNHVKKSVEYVDHFKENYNFYKINFDFKGVDISIWIKNVILSHANSVQYALNTDLFPTAKLVHDFSVNVQFIAFLLRLGDILDFDLFRTPPFLYNHINPKNKISILEWRKHQSIEGFQLTPQKISFEAYCENATIERAVRNFTEWIELERHDTMAVISQKNYNGYKLQLNSTIELKVRNNGSYIFSDLQLSLDYEKVLNILMGTELYETADVFVREIIQNSYDACMHRSELFSRSAETYIPKIHIKYDSNTRVLELKDNGIGMDQAVFENYLLKIGRSYYKSKIFESQRFSFEPISNFGIGILSCFMVSNSIEIESLKAYSPTESAEPIHYILSLDSKFIDQRKSTKTDFGTTIRLTLKDDYASKLRGLKDLISENMLLQDIPIQVDEDGEVVVLNNHTIIVQQDLLDIKGITILHIKSTDWMDGYVALYENQHQSIIGGNQVSQQCFMLTRKKSNINIIPKWISRCKVVINIKPPHRLRLKANRNGVHDDEKLVYLKNFMMDFFIDQFETLPSSNFLKYFNDGRSNVLSGSKREFQFLINTIPLAILDSRGARTDHFGKVFSSLIGNRLILLNPIFLANDDNRKRLLPTLAMYKLIALQANFYEYLFLFSDPYIEHKEIIITDIPGVILYELTFKKDIKLDVSAHMYEYKFDSKMSITYKGDERRIFCIVGNRGTNLIDFHFNDIHPLGALLKKSEHTSYTKRFKGSFKTNINTAVNKKMTLTQYTNYDGELFFVQNEVQSGSLKSVGILTQKFLDSTNVALKVHLLEPLRREGFIQELDFDKYLLSLADFPEWWFSDRIGISE